MAITMKSEQIKFLAAEMLKGNAGIQQTLQSLQSGGWVLSIGLFTLSLSKGEAHYEAKSPVSLSSFPTLPESQKHMASQALIKLVDSVWVEHWYAVVNAAGASAKTENPASEVQMPPSPATDAFVQGGQPTPQPAQNVSAVSAVSAVSEGPVGPVPETIPLKDAKAIRQKVFGTSGGSVYTTVAVGALNVAVRIKSDTVSIRAEFPDGNNSAIIKQLTSLGFTNQDKYLSMHIVLSGFPAERVIGSMLYAMNVEFTAIATNKGDFA